MLERRRHRSEGSARDGVAGASRGAPRRTRRLAAVDIAEGLALALELAEIADAITIDRFRAVDLVVETKPDLTPVTEADQAVERALRAHLAERAPSHGVLGEEYGDEHGDATARRFRWVIDPIDGTKSYVRGVPVWATLIALEHAGRAGRRGRVRRPRSARAGGPAAGSAPSATARRSRCRAVHELDDAQTLVRVGHEGALRSRRHRRTHARRSRTGAGGCGGSATSGSTCSSPRARSTSRSTRSSPTGTRPRCSRSSRKPAAAGARVDG